MTKGFNINSDELTAHRTANPLKGGELPPAVKAIIVELKREARRSELEESSEQSETVVMMNRGWRRGVLDAVERIEQAAKQ